MPDRCLLYYITDRKAFAPDEPARRRCLLEKISELACAGVDYIQLREKDLSTRELESLAREAISAIHEAKKRSAAPGPLTPALLINSRTDVALAAGADGVHLRVDDVSPQEVRKIWRRSGTTANRDCQTPQTGVSCHSAGEVAKAAADGATFAVFAPVFEKKDEPGRQPAGLARLRDACRAPIPVLALGGITLENARSCLEAGATGIAAIRLFQEHDGESVANRLRQLAG